MPDHLPKPAVAAALVEEAAKRSSVGWIAYDGQQRPRPAWHVWSDGAAYVVAAGEKPGGAADPPRHSGPPGQVEQQLPGLAAAHTATVTWRAKDTGARLVTWRARVERLTPGTPAWDAAVAALRGERLNATAAAELPQRWATSAVIVRLVPTGEIVEAPGTMPDTDQAAPPPPTPATTTGRLPWVVHRRPRHRPRLS